MSRHSPVVIDGRTYDLVHLDPLTFATPSEKLKREITTWCRFTTHTFTRTPVGGEAGPFIYDEGNRPRVFCPVRYELSLKLKGAILQLTEPWRHVSETAAERSWMHEVSVTVAFQGATVRYQIFFAVKKAARAARHDVEMTVESAYAYDPKREPKLRGRILIAGLLTAVVQGRKPHTQRAHRRH